MLEAGILLAVVVAAAIGFKIRAAKKPTGNRGGGSGGSGRRGNHIK